MLISRHHITQHSLFIVIVCSYLTTTIFPPLYAHHCSGSSSRPTSSASQYKDILRLDTTTGLLLQPQQLQGTGVTLHTGGVDPKLKYRLVLLFSSLVLSLFLSLTRAHTHIHTHTHTRTYIHAYTQIPSNRVSKSRVAEEKSWNIRSVALWYQRNGWELTLLSILKVQSHSSQHKELKLTPSHFNTKSWLYICAPNPFCMNCEW
jgi:hypothetical protein